MFPKNFVYFRFVGNEVTHKSRSVKNFIQFFRFFIGVWTNVNNVTLEQFAFPFPMYLVAATTCRYIIGDGELENKAKLHWRRYRVERQKDIESKSWNNRTISYSAISTGEFLHGFFRNNTGWQKPGANPRLHRSNGLFYLQQGNRNCRNGIEIPTT